ncbi:unnamed protein product [Cylicocyclus nassatus]|uniref:Uncharacterized protein n=1 Tax=Cylicocyclus nassatus TaxID=53992 RepID=A0AA36H623_CYLNA|nr:unnamed protein product [Cylicocyclus nassatus]
MRRHWMRLQFCTAKHVEGASNMSLRRPRAKSFGMCTAEARRWTANELRQESSQYISTNHERSCGRIIGEGDVDEVFGEIEESDEKEHEDEKRKNNWCRE